MRRVSEFAAICLTAVILSLPRVSAAEETVIDKPFEVESGIVVLRKTMTTPAVTTERTETLYFKDWGRVQARHGVETTTNKYVKGEQVARTVSILEGTVITTVDLDKKTGTRMQNPMADELGKMTRGEAQDFADKLAEGTNTTTEKVAQEEVAGKLCDVHKTVTKMGSMEQITRLWFWKNLILKTTSSGMGTEIVEEATSVETDVAIPADKFQIPAEIKVVEMTNPLGGLGKSKSKSKTK